MQKFTKKYGLITVCSMVVGIVIGSGVFYKAQDILIQLDGNMPLGILAWVIGGAVMLFCSLAFANMATMYERVGGVVDYAEATCGAGFAYYLSWFLATIHYPSLVSVLAWVSARFIGALFGWEISGGNVMMLAGVILVFSFSLNAISPRLAGKFQVTSTVIKLIPLVLMAVVGTIHGISTGIITESFAPNATNPDNLSIFGAIVATAFAYEGWIIATSINAEVSDAKRNLPKALIFGGLVIILVYVLYYIGISGAVSAEVLMRDGATAAFVALFGKGFGVILNVFVAVSCLGTLNGLMLATIRAFYVTGARLKGQKSAYLLELNPHTNIPNNSAILGLLTSAVWLFYFYGANVTDGWFGLFNFDSSELPVITIYALYIPIFINFMRKKKDLTPTKRFIIPALATIASVFIIFATVYAHGIRPHIEASSYGKFSFPVLFYLIIFALIMLGGFVLKRLSDKADKELETKE